MSKHTLLLASHIDKQLLNKFNKQVEQERRYKRVVIEAALQEYLDRHAKPEGVS